MALVVIGTSVMTHYGGHLGVGASVGAQRIGQLAEHCQ